jgi:hypothetical protein
MYVDPSAGSLILQLLAAGVIAGAAMITRVRDAVRHFVRSVVFRRRTK